MSPEPRIRHAVGFALLLASTATLMTNAYFLRFAEPSISRKAVAAIVLAITAGFFVATRVQWPTSRDGWSSLARRSATPLTLAAILVVAFTLRVDGIKSGLPQSYTPDEYDYVHSYLQMIKRGDMNPRWWHHPSVQPYTNIVAYLAVYYLSAGSGRWGSLQELQVEDMLYWGRFAAGVVPGTLAVLIVFFLGQRVFSTRVGLLGAAILAVAPGVVEASQYNKPDALLVLFATVSVLVTMIYLDRGGRGLAFGAGAAVGFAVAVKYNAALLLIPLFIALLLHHGLRVLSRPDAYLGGLGAISGFVAGCPYFYADLARFLEHVGAGIYNYGYVGLEGASGEHNWLTHARYTMNYGAGVWAYFAALAGLAIALYRIDRRLIVFLAYPVLYYSFYSSQKINFAGNLMPVYPFFAILAGLAVSEIASVTSARIGGRLAWRPGAAAPALTVVAMLLVLRAPTATSLHRNHIVTLPDTGTVAAQWIESRYPPNTHFAVERQTPVLDRDRFQITEESVLARRAVRDYRQAGVEYLIVSSTVYDRFGPNSQRARIYEKLFSICPLVKEFAPEEGRIYGPTIRVLRIPPEDETQPS